MKVQPYKIEFLEKASQIPDDLWEVCFRAPGEGRWWYEAVEQSGIDDQFTFFYGLIKHLGSPVGIVPVFVMDMPVEQVAPQDMVELQSRRKEDYFAAMTGSRRQNLKRKLRRSRERVALNVEIVQRPDAKTLDDIFALFWQTYEKSPSKFERLSRKFFEVFAEKQATLFILLREKVTSELVAFKLCFDMGERLVSLFIGMDYSRPKEWMLFFRLWEAAIDLALSRGFTTIVSGRSSYDVKIETGHTLVRLNNYCRHRNVLLNTIYGMIAQRLDWASLDEALGRLPENASRGVHSPN